MRTKRWAREACCRHQFGAERIPDLRGDLTRRVRGTYAGTHTTFSLGTSEPLTLGRSRCKHRPHGPDSHILSGTAPYPIRRTAYDVRVREEHLPVLMATQKRRKVANTRYGG